MSLKDKAPTLTKLELVKQKKHFKQFYEMGHSIIHGIL